MFRMLVKLQVLGSSIDLMDISLKRIISIVSMCELLICEAHGGKLIRHFSVVKTLDVLHEHFYWPKMKKDVQGINDKYTL
jgi:16S rRNA C1402 (ribose-2'-O) methylase RsmI